MQIYDEDQRDGTTIVKILDVVRSSQKEIVSSIVTFVKFDTVVMHSSRSRVAFLIPSAKS